MQIFKSPENYAATVLGMANSPEAARGLIVAGMGDYPQVPAKFWLDVLALLEDERPPEDRAIDLAEAAFDHAARRQFEADGSADIGDCGGVLLGWRGNTRFSRALLARGLGYKCGGRMMLRQSLPEGVRTQHRAVYEKAHDAFAAVAAAAGFEAVEHRSYAD